MVVQQITTSGNTLEVCSGFPQFGFGVVWCGRDTQLTAEVFVGQETVVGFGSDCKYS